MTSNVTIENLKEDFDIYGVQLGENNEVHEKCLYLMEKYDIDAEQIAICWLGFSGKKGYDEITKERLDQFESEELVKKNKVTKQSESCHQGKFIGNTSELSTIEDDDIYAAYGLGGSVKDENSRNVNSCSTPKGRKSLVQNSMASDSPLAPSLSQSPISQRYSSRNNSGAVVAVYGDQQDAEGVQNIDFTPEVKQLACGGDSPLTSSYNFMFEKLRDCAESLDETIFSLGEQMKESLGIEETGILRATTNVSSWFVGRICCDSVGRLNAASVLLEGDRENCYGDSVHLDLSKLPSYSVFPGQVVAVRGINPTGQHLLAEELVIGKNLPLPELPITLNEKVLEIRLACGPFTTSENLQYEPLSDLLQEVLKERPQILILLGPLLDSSHPALSDPLLSDTYDSIVDRCLMKVQVTLQNTPTKVFVVTNARDVSCPMVFPTPPVFLNGESTAGEIQLLPDPSLLNIEGVVIGITTNDVLMHISKEEISFPSQSSDRFARLSMHLLLQQTFYPLYPPPEDFALSLENADINARLPVKPHLLVLPSDFRGFVKDVDDCIIINPEKLTKGKVGGSYCKLRIRNSREPKRVKVDAKILRI